MSYATEVHPAARRRTRLLMTLVLALPAFLLTNETFQPVEIQVSLEGEDASHVFSLDVAEPLLLETEFAVRPPAQADATLGSAALLLTLNGVRVARVEAEQLYVVNRAMPLAPVAAVRGGTNRLEVTLDGPSSFAFDATLRIHNYRGINPRFPRAFVVPDEAVAHFFARGSVVRHLVRLAVIGMLGLVAVWGIAMLARRQSRAGSMLLLLSPATLLWATLLYGLTSPLHVWLSAGAVLALALVPGLLAAGALWILPRRRAVALVAAATAVVLVACEAGLRLINLVVPSPIFYTDSYSRFRGEPGAPFLDSRLNSLGFNDVEHAPDRPAGVRYRIATIGDSMVFGVVPYAANAFTLLEAALAPEGPIEVVNMGVPGTAPRDYLSILVNEGLAFEPDLVMVGFFIGNDFEATAREPYEHSYLATAGYFVWRLFTAGAPAETVFQASGPTYADDAPTFAEARFFEIEVGRAWIYATADVGLDAALDEALGTLRQMRDIAARSGADFLLVLLPDEAQVDGDLAGRVADAYGAGPGRLDFARPNARLVDALTREAIPFLDLLPVFAEAGQQTRLYKPRDTHWNLAGNRLAAETIAPIVRERIQTGR